MTSINMQNTPLRELFLRKYEALLVLRGVSPYLLGPRQAAMEVLLNLGRHPSRQANYLKAMIRTIGRLIIEHIETQPYHIPADQCTLWDLPGHVEGNPRLRLCVLCDPDPAAPAAAYAASGVELILSDGE